MACSGLDGWAEKDTRGFWKRCDSSKSTTTPIGFQTDHHV
jgi:hypothetical protein